MTEQTAAEMSEELTRESLMDFTREDLEKGEQSEEPETAEAETLAETQDDDEQAEAVVEPETAGAFPDTELGDFLAQVGLEPEEFYGKLYRTINGEKVYMSGAWDDREKLRHAHDALLRERDELQKQVQTASAQMPQMQTSPEVEALLAQARMYQQQLHQTDWSTLDPGTAANHKSDLMLAIQDLSEKAQAKHAEHMQKMQTKIREAQMEADRQVRANIKEWSDPQVYQQEWRQIGDMLKSYGITQPEIDAVMDPRIKRMLRDHLLLRGKEERITQKAKKLRKVSKHLGASSRSPERPKPTLEDARKQLAEAKKRGATREELAKLRLSLPLG